MWINALVIHSREKFYDYSWIDLTLSRGFLQSYPQKKGVLNDENFSEKAYSKVVFSMIDEVIMNNTAQTMLKNPTPYKVIFSDIDGTLLNSQHQISVKNKQAIQRLANFSVPFILVSARPPLAITPFTEQLQTQNPLIAYSGALILDQHLQPLYSVTIAPADLTQVEQLLADFPHLSINHYAGVHWFSNDLNNEWTKLEEKITGLQAVEKPQDLTEVHKILVIGEANEILNLEKALKTQFPHLSIHRSKNEYLEIMHKQATKSNAIRFLEQALDFTAEETIAFGDNFNDLDMLQYAGLSVAMANAPEAIQTAAKRVTASNNEDGIALVLNEIFTD